MVAERHATLADWRNQIVAKAEEYHEMVEMPERLLKVREDERERHGRKALQIQSAFRGMRGRRTVNEKRSQGRIAEALGALVQELGVQNGGSPRRRGKRAPGSTTKMTKSVETRGVEALAKMLGTAR